MLVRFGQAAMFAAIMILTMNSARAEDPPAKSACGACCKDNDCCKTAKCAKTACKCEDCCKDGKCCCKDSKCCNDGECCCKDGKCCKDGACCCKDSKCCKSGECCASKQCCKGAGGCSCCAAKGKHTKKAAVVGPILVFVPVPMTMTPPAMPVCAGCPMGYGPMPVPMPPPPGLTPPAMPSQSVVMPVPPPPPMCYACPTSGTQTCAPIMSCPADVGPPHKETGVDMCLSILGMATDLCSCHSQPLSLPSMCLSALGMAVDLCGDTSTPNVTPPSGQYLQHPPQYMPPSPQLPEARSVAILPPPTPTDSPYYCPAQPTVTCSAACPATAATKVRIVAKPSSDQLEMSIGDDTCMSCKKMVVKLGDSSLTLTRIEGKVRVRGTELKAKADCVRTDRKDRLVLEGDVVLHYSKDGQCAKVTAECVELNLATGSVTVKGAGLERIGVNFP